MMKRILDACCGTRQVWYNKRDPNTIFMDKYPRTFEDGMGRTLECNPDIVGDFRDMPFENEVFDLILWDPPHIDHAGINHWIRNKYGCAEKETWRADLKAGFDECMRVLRPGGTLVLKWSDVQLKLREVLAAVEATPTFGDRGKGPNCIWCVFYKSRSEIGGMDDENPA